jgi:selenocysteine lyase/cysteine desulfurase
MERRTFLGTAAHATLGSYAGLPRFVTGAQERAFQHLFPRAERETFLNAAGGTPLATFAEAGITRYLDYIRYGPGEGRGEYRERAWAEVRGLFAGLIGARESEIGLVESTKAGEQLLIEGLPALRRGGNIVTNDLHFSGSLHNLDGLRRAGMDVRIVRASPAFEVSLERMADEIDDRTALVTVSLVSNVNGHIEPIAELARLAHDRGAVVFADVIQAAGAIPIDVHGMGIDVAACSSYKWLFGIHGAGFLFVADRLQGTVLPDRLFPGHVRRTYVPWSEGVGAADDFTYTPPSTAERYQPGHVNYLGYAAVYEGLRFLHDVGVPRVRAHSAALVARLLDQIDQEAYGVLTPQPDQTPILSLRPWSVEGLRELLASAQVTVSVGGDMDRLMRISPAIFNTPADIDRLAEVLERHLRA